MKTHIRNFKKSPCLEIDSEYGSYSLIQKISIVAQREDCNLRGSKQEAGEIAWR